MLAGNKSLLAVALAAFSMHASALSVTPVDDGTTLATTIQGTGVTIVPGSVNYIGASGQAGVFAEGTASGLGIDTGILLTTGLAADADGPNDFTDFSTELGTGGNADLQAVRGGETFDANMLEFQFESSGGTLSINYVFASEDYNEFVNDDPAFHDVFAFLVDGVNIATIGGEPVSVDTINCGDPFGSADVNCELLNNNPTGEGTFDLEYDAFTNVLTATYSGLTAGVHTLQLGIADRGDAFVDSAVFIQAGSLRVTGTEPTPVSEPATLALFGLGLLALGLNRRRA